jgi:hypothetical protein
MVRIDPALTAANAALRLGQLPLGQTVHGTTSSRGTTSRMGHLSHLKAFQANDLKREPRWDGTLCLIRGECVPAPENRAPRHRGNRVGRAGIGRDTAGRDTSGRDTCRDSTRIGRWGRSPLGPTKKDPCWWWGSFFTKGGQKIPGNSESIGTGHKPRRG